MTDEIKKVLWTSADKLRAMVEADKVELTIALPEHLFCKLRLPEAEKIVGEVGYR